MGRHRWGLAILPRNAASLALQVVDSPSFMRDRVAAAVPWPPNEVGERRHPLECRLRSLISFTKGCYIGQEVIARLDAYRKVQMALTRFEGMLDPGESAPVTLQTSGGAEAGVVTSIAIGATRIHSLGFLRLDHLREGRSVNTPQGAILRPVDTDPEEGIYA
jgi:folate-binding protein YgfZ